MRTMGLSASMVAAERPIAIALRRLSPAHCSGNGASARRARPALDVRGGISSPHRVAGLEPRVALRGSAVDCVDTGESALADGTEHASVVGAERAGYLANWLAGSLSR